MCGSGAESKYQARDDESLLNYNNEYYLTNLDCPTRFGPGTFPTQVLPTADCAIKNTVSVVLYLKY